MQTRHTSKDKKRFDNFLFLFLFWSLCSHGISHAEEAVKTKTQFMKFSDKHSYQTVTSIPFYLAENYPDSETSNQHHTDDSSFTGVTTSDQGIKAEYNRLLEEKKKLDNNKSFQKRRMKRKYKHRPYIKELIKKEQQIINRLEEIELMMKAKKSDKK